MKTKGGYGGSGIVRKLLKKLWLIIIFLIDRR